MMYGLDLEEDGGKNMAAELMYTTHSKLYGFNDRHDDHPSRRERLMRCMTKLCVSNLKVIEGAIDTCTLQVNV